VIADPVNCYFVTNVNMPLLYQFFSDYCANDRNNNSNNCNKRTNGKHMVSPLAYESDEGRDTQPLVSFKILTPYSGHRI
jgi:hypothetical protein